MLNKYDGDFFWQGCFCIGKTEDGKYYAFDNLEDYQAYRDAERKEKQNDRIQRILH